MDGIYMQLQQIFVFQDMDHRHGFSVMPKIYNGFSFGKLQPHSAIRNTKAGVKTVFYYVGTYIMIIIENVFIG